MCKSSVKVTRCPICNYPVFLEDPDNLCENCGTILNHNGVIIVNPFSQEYEDREYVESGIDFLWDPETEKIAEEYIK